MEFGGWHQCGHGLLLLLRRSATFCRSKKWMARGQGGSQKVIFPAFRLVSWQETSIFEKNVAPSSTQCIKYRRLFGSLCNIKSLSGRIITKGKPWMKD